MEMKTEIFSKDHAERYGDECRCHFFMEEESEMQQRGKYENPFPVSLPVFRI